MFYLNSYSWSQYDLETSTLAQIILYYSYYNYTYLANPLCFKIPKNFILL